MGTRRCSPRPMGPTARSPELLSGTHCRWDPRGWTGGPARAQPRGRGQSRAGRARGRWRTPLLGHPARRERRQGAATRKARSRLSPPHGSAWGSDTLGCAIPGGAAGAPVPSPGAHLPCGAGRAGLSPTCRCSREDAPAVAAISTPSSFLVRNMSPRYQGTEMVTSRSLQDTTLSPLKRWGCGMTVDRDRGPEVSRGRAGLPRSGGKKPRAFSFPRKGRSQTPVVRHLTPSPGALGSAEGHIPGGQGLGFPTVARAQQGALGLAAGRVGQPRVPGLRGRGVGGPVSPAHLSHPTPAIRWESVSQQ